MAASAPNTANVITADFIIFFILQSILRLIITSSSDRGTQ